MKLVCVALMFALSAAAAAQAGPAATPVRTPLADVSLTAPKTVEMVKVTRVDFAPGQAMPRQVVSQFEI